ncbi:hypothetical protein HS041_00935 [Planomonospora sp. ID67723]|uniref:hypothetical protein n=1 Tax=Planomonospora sp. ID67723 TaxID=2738134 RepID=UPI0018C3F408|nr:hypothetical protein [Planomonospora sp. ID67723]MBG0826347.1 hypothetical protein [Planomonospora sp. ID67723]
MARKIVDQGTPCNRPPEADAVWEHARMPPVEALAIKVAASSLGPLLKVASDAGVKKSVKRQRKIETGDRLLVAAIGLCGYVAAHHAAWESPRSRWLTIASFTAHTLQGRAWTGEWCAGLGNASQQVIARDAAGSKELLQVVLDKGERIAALFLELSMCGDEQLVAAGYQVATAALDFRGGRDGQQRMEAAVEVFGMQREWLARSWWQRLMWWRRPKAAR